MKNKLKKELRDSLRQSRRNLLSKDQVLASKRVFDLVIEQGFFISATYVAFYLSFDGEIDPRPIAQRAMDQGKSCYLPIISDEDAHQMAFDLYDQSSILKENKWGIEEPVPQDRQISPANLDLVFVPLVGFDENCSRLGMGKGLFDKTFNFKNQNSLSQPLLVGLAHECQRVQKIPAEDWDVKLDLVVTAKKIYQSKIG